METGTTGDDPDAFDFRKEFSGCMPEGIGYQMAGRDPPFERLDDRRRLLVDLFLHKVAEVAKLRAFARDGGVLDLALNRFARLV